MKAIGVIIFSSDKQSILLSKRSKHEENEIGKWENVGGKLEEGETFEEAVVREVREELNVQAKDIELKLVYGDENSDFCVKLFAAQIDGEPQIMEPEYCDELRWFELSELEDLDLATYTKEDFQKLNWI